MAPGNRCTGEAGTRRMGAMGLDVMVGCCGFPVGRGRYFGRFPVVELQQTFYQLPTVELAETWRRQAPSSFIYTLKAWQLITHPASSPTYRRLREPLSEADRNACGYFRPTRQVRQAWERTLEVARALGSPLVVFQCPASFTATSEHLQALVSFFEKAPRDGLTLAWEPRGRWDPSLVRELCQRLGLVHCVDPFSGPCQHGEIAYLRLHGIGGYRYRYTDEDLGRLAAVCREELAAGRRAVYAMFNNVHMLEDAQRFQSLLAGE
jgi:uncharacterized protein YecE (DUF72 family)